MKATFRDPFFCAGTMKTHLASLGFTSVRNENVDAYESFKTPPDYDVLITNPPFSGNHVEKLMAFCKSQQPKPALILIPK